MPRIARLFVRAKHTSSATVAPARATTAAAAIALAAAALIATLAPTPPSLARTDRVAQWQPWTWTFEQVARLRSQESINIIRADVDAWGKAHLVAWKGDLSLGRSWWYATNASDSWVINDDRILQKHDPPNWVAMDLSGEGVPHMLTGYQSLGVGDIRQIEVTEWAFDASARSNPWKATSVLNHATTLVGDMTAFGGDMDAGAGAGAERQGYFGFRGTCFALETKSGMWTSTPLVEGSADVNKAFAVDTMHRPHILCGTKYFHRDGGSWADEIVTGLNGTDQAFLAIDSEGRPAIVAFEPSPSLKVTFFRRIEQGWASTETSLPSRDRGTMKSFRITASGVPEIVLVGTRDEHSLHLSVYDGTAWHAQVVELDIAAGYVAQMWEDFGLQLTVPDGAGVRHAMFSAEKCPSPMGIICPFPMVYHARIDDHGTTSPTGVAPPTAAPATETPAPPTPVPSTAESTQTAPPAATTTPPAPSPTAAATAPRSSATPVEAPPAKLYMPALHRGAAPLIQQASMARNSQMVLTAAELRSSHVRSLDDDAGPDEPVGSSAGCASSPPTPAPPSPAPPPSATSSPATARPPPAAR